MEGGKKYRVLWKIGTDGLIAPVFEEVEKDE